MPFIGYESFENHYCTKNVNYLRANHSEALQGLYIAQQKYDGSNFQIIFEKTETGTVSIKYASRNRLLEDSENFNNHKAVVQKDVYAKMLENIRKFLESRADLDSINLHGEIYGQVFRRVNYYAPGENTKENKLVFFDVKFNEKPQQIKYFVEWAKEMEIPVAEIYLIGTFDECMAVPVNTFKSVGGDQIEGVVIKPYELIDENLARFYLKKKVEGFEEKNMKSGEKEVKQPAADKPKYGNLKCSDEQKKELEKYEEYLNANRAISALSKRPWSMADLAVLANEVLADAFKDFKSENETATIDLNLAKKALLPVAFNLVKTEMKAKAP